MLPVVYAWVLVFYHSLLRFKVMMSQAYLLRILGLRHPNLTAKQGVMKSNPDIHSRQQDLSPIFAAAFIEELKSLPSFFFFKGTVQRDFLPPIFSLIDSSQAPYSAFKGFPNLASNSERYSRFLIDSLL